MYSINSIVSYTSHCILFHLYSLYVDNTLNNCRSYYTALQGEMEKFSGQALNKQAEEALLPPCGDKENILKITTDSQQHLEVMREDLVFISKLES